MLSSRVCSQCTSLLAPFPRPSAISLGSRLVATPHSAIFSLHRARARSTAFGSGVVSHSRGVRSRFSRTRQWRCCLNVCSRCAARRAPALRPSAVSLASCFVETPHSAVFGRCRAPIAPLPSALASYLTVAAFVVPSLAPANAVLSSHVCSQNPASRAPSLRPSAVSLASRLVAAPHSAIFI